MRLRRYVLIRKKRSSGVFIPSSRVPPPPPPPNTDTLPYPIGIYGLTGTGDLDPNLADQPGLVGVNLHIEWPDVEKSQGVYDWSRMDALIQQAKDLGFTAIVDTPQWMLDLLPDDKKIDIIDDAQQHPEYCKKVPTALYWNPTWHAARKAMIVSAGARYSSDENIVAVLQAAAFNQNSSDWHIQDTVDPGFTCPPCPGHPPQLCGPQPLDQPQQWLDAGWTRERMLVIGKEMADTAAAAWPRQNLKLPIGGLDDRLAMDTPLNDGYSRLARDMELYIYGSDGTRTGPPRPYADRFYMSRNILTATWESGPFFDTFTPGFGAQRYIQYMIRRHARDYNRRAGLQSVADATDGGNDCALNGSGACVGCVPGANPPAVALCMIQAAIAVAVTYETTFYEVFAKDARNLAFRQAFIDGTIAMGGTPRF
jgi:hypothetical protein